MCLNFLFVDDKNANILQQRNTSFYLSGRTWVSSTFPRRFISAPLIVLIHPDFQLEPTARSSASSHLVHRIKDIIKDNIKDTEILFSFTLSEAALINFHFSLHPLLSLDETLILNTDTLTASAVLSVISLEETKCSIVVSLATFYFNSH